MLDNTLMNTEGLSFSATYSTFVYLILLYYISYIFNKKYQIISKRLVAQYVYKF